MRWSHRRLRMGMSGNNTIDVFKPKVMFPVREAGDEVG